MTKKTGKNDWGVVSDTDFDTGMSKDDAMKKAEQWAQRGDRCVEVFKVVARAKVHFEMVEA